MAQLEAICRYSALLLSGLLLLSGCPAPQSASSFPSSRLAQSPTTHVNLKEAVHFSAADGKDIVVPAGGYHVEFAGDQQLRLIPDRDESGSILLAARKADSLIEVPVPAAQVIAEPEEPDIRHVVIFLPDKTAWDAAGSISGVRPRGLPSATIPIGKVLQQLQWKFPLPATPQFPQYKLFPHQLLFFHPDKSFMWYGHLVDSNNTVGWQVQDGFHFFTDATWTSGMGTAIHQYRKIFSAGRNTLYQIMPNGHLVWMIWSYSPSQGKILNFHGQEVGQGWQNFIRVFGGHNPTGGSDYGGLVIYAITASGDLLWYSHAGWVDGLPANQAGAWLGPVKVGNGWQNFSHVFSGCEGVIYAVNANGDLLWYRHHGYQVGAGTDWPNAWEGPKVIAPGWTTSMVAAGGTCCGGIALHTLQTAAADCTGLIYVLFTNGDLKWYYHLTYMTGGQGLIDLGPLKPGATGDHLVVIQP
jgi:hypothetical protein